MRKLTFGLLIATLLSISALAQSRKGIRGVWQITEVTSAGPSGTTVKATQPSMYLFTRKHYSIIYVDGDKPRTMMEDYAKATQEELLSIFVDNFIANAGTYEVKAGKLTVHPMVAKSPGYMQAGSWATSSMKINGDMMTLTSESTTAGPVQNPTTFKLKRVE